MLRREDDYMFKIEEILENWVLEKPYRILEVNVEVQYEIRQPNAWFVNDNFLLKRFKNPDWLQNGIVVLKALDGEGVPVAVPVETKGQTSFCTVDNEYFCLYPRLRGKGLIDHFEGDYLNRAEYLGQIVGNLHLAFKKCEGIIPCSENNLLSEIMNWAIPAYKEFAENRGIRINDQLINSYITEFSSLYGQLPRQIIHRDIHGENLLFENGRLSGYIDFDLSQRNVRVFDPCYLSTDILSGCFEAAEKREKWIVLFKSIINGYDSVCTLRPEEKKALVYVLLSIEFIFIAYFAGNGYPQLAEANIKMLNWIYENRSCLEVL